MIKNKKHLAFIDALFANGMNQRAAYQAVYQNVKDKAADVNASRLMVRPEIAAEIARRQALTSAKFNITKEELLKDLKYIKDKYKDSFAPAAIKAIEVIAKMTGLNEPQKIEHSGSIDINLQTPGVELNDDTDESEEN